MTLKIKLNFVVTLLIVTLSSISSIAIADYPIAGVTPFQRPKNAPVILNINKDKVWYGRALSGVVAPYPVNLKFLEDQGNWYTPFIYPGFNGRYDIRNWHKK